MVKASNIYVFSIAFLPADIIHHVRNLVVAHHVGVGKDLAVHGPWICDYLGNVSADVLGASECAFDRAVTGDVLNVGDEKPVCSARWQASNGNGLLRPPAHIYDCVW